MSLTNRLNNKFIMDVFPSVSNGTPKASTFYQYFKRQIKMTDRIDKIARQQLTDYKNNNPGTIFRDKNFSITIDEAYAVQDALVKLRLKEGTAVIGYKVGCTGPGITKLFGIDGPIRGTLFDKEVHESGVKLNAKHFCNLAVEAEMAIQIGVDGQITSVFPVIELHNFVFCAPKKSLPELIANNGLNKGIVLSQLNWWTFPEAYKKTSVLSLEINGSIIDTGDLWPMEGGPVSSLQWLEAHLLEYDLKTSPGNIILGGTALGIHTVKTGDRVDVKVDGKTAVQCFIGMDN